MVGRRFARVPTQPKNDRSTSSCVASFLPYRSAPPFGVLASFTDGSTGYARALSFHWARVS